MNQYQIVEYLSRLSSIERLSIIEKMHNLSHKLELKRTNFPQVQIMEEQ